MSRPRKWPLVLIASPAAVAVWSGWVGLGKLCGFGEVTPFPGIVKFALNTAITLPVGVEAYGAYALGAWLAPGEVSVKARKFAKRSAIGALGLGMLGQVVYHLLAAAHATWAPWPVVVLVSCLPVVTLGFGAALTHLLRAPAPAGGTAPGARTPAPAPAGRPAPETRSAPAPGARPVPAPEVRSLSAPARTRNAPERTRGVTRSTVTDVAAEKHFAADLAAGQVPSARRIRAELHVGQDRAQAIWRHLNGRAQGWPGDPALHIVSDGGAR